jgi:catechol 2,3-dioxygenase-like lactoylglutathione lyase family enzyme
MAKPKLKHLALFARKPKELAEFYRDTFDMEIISSSPLGAQFLTDGYITLAILPHRLESDSAVGLNHFGFTVESVPEMSKKLVAKGVEEPKKRPSGRPYAEFRAVDPEGNQFDIGEDAYQEKQLSERRKAAATS